MFICFYNYLTLSPTFLYVNSIVYFYMSPEISNNLTYILTSVDPDDSVQTPSKLRNSKFCSVSSLTIIEYSSDELI